MTDFNIRYGKRTNIKKTFFKKGKRKCLYIFTIVRDRSEVDRGGHGVHVGGMNFEYVIRMYNI